MLERLVQRREALALRSAALREQVVADAADIAPRLRAADRVVTTLRAHPVLTGIAMTGVMFLGSRAFLRWAARILPIYSVLRRL